MDDERLDDVERLLIDDMTLSDIREAIPGLAHDLRGDGWTPEALQQQIVRSVRESIPLGIILSDLSALADRHRKAREVLSDDEIHRAFNRAREAHIPFIDACEIEWKNRRRDAGSNAA